MPGRLAVIALIFFGYLCIHAANAAQLLEGKVVGVSDGDTITVLDSGRRQYKIRLSQIDAPEKRQDYGMRSKRSLSRLVYGKQVSVEIAATDKYGRAVGKVLVDGKDANLEQVQRGMAWVYRAYAKDHAYFAAEDSARKARIGLWAQADPVPPWKFRHEDNRGSPSKGSAMAETIVRQLLQSLR
jgi:endonuclease YncB( thermonuclease family)